jgi:hypothetical protein
VQQRRFFLMFIISVEVLLEADRNDFFNEDILLFCLSLSSLCIIYPRGGQSALYYKKGFS